MSVLTTLYVQLVLSYPDDGIPKDDGGIEICAILPCVTNCCCCCVVIDTVVAVVVA